MVKIMPNKITIDLHGHTTESALKLITQRLKNLPDDVKEIEIIHGYNGGTTLQQAIRRYKNKKVKNKIVGLNNGITTFIIKPKSEED